MNQIHISDSWFRHLQKFTQSVEEKRAAGEDYQLELDMLLGWLSSVSTIIQTKQ